MNSPAPPVLSDDALRHRYESAGFLVLSRLLDTATAQRASHIYDAVIGRWDSQRSATLTVCPALHWEMPPAELSSRLLHGALLDALQAVAQTILRAPAEVSARIFYKAPGAATTKPHQDRAYSPHNHRERINIWIPLEPVDAENGCLYYYPGSHRGGLLPHRLDPSDPHGHTLSVVSLPAGEQVPVPLATGDAVVHHRDVVHGAFGNSSPLPRRGLVAVCQAAGPGPDSRS